MRETQDWRDLTQLRADLDASRLAEEASAFEAAHWHEQFNALWEVAFDLAQQRDATQQQARSLALVLVFALLGFAVLLGELAAR